MTVNELLDTMTIDFRKTLWNIFIDNENFFEYLTDDPEFFESDVNHWYIDNSTLYIFTGEFVIKEIQKRNSKIGLHPI